MDSRRIRLAFGGLLIAAALAGCGSSEKENATASSSAPSTETASTTSSTGGTATTNTTGTAGTTGTSDSTGTTTGTPETKTEPMTSSPASQPQDTAVKGPQVVVNLEGGKSFTLQLDQQNTPKTVAGILALVNKGFYSGIRVHRVEPGFCVQWGDPISKNGADAPGVGSGGTGKNLPFETGKLSFVKGTLGMASTGTGVGGDCQMFVTTGDAKFLDGGYSAFGKVSKGMDVVENIQKGDKILSMKVVK